jgi:hypothetical protein
MVLEIEDSSTGMFHVTWRISALGRKAANFGWPIKASKTRDKTSTGSLLDVSVDLLTFVLFAPFLFIDKVSIPHLLYDVQ